MERQQPPPNRRANPANGGINFATFAIVLIAIALGLSNVGSPIVAVPEGHVGVFYRGGALLNSVTQSGFALKLPFITTVAFVQTTMQTDEVVNIPCGTRGGVLIHFEKIEVVNILNEKYVINTTRSYGLNYDKIWIFDKIHHEINQFCSKHTLQEVYIDEFDTIDESLQSTLQSDCEKYNTGITIVAVRVTKPKVPEAVRQNYENMVLETTKFMITKETQKIVELEAETESIKAKIEAATVAEVAAIQKEIAIFAKNTMKNISMIQDEINSSHEKALADATSYHHKVEAEALAQLLTPQYLEYLRIQGISSKNTIVFGNSIPSFLPAEAFQSKK